MCQVIWLVLCSMVWHTYSFFKISFSWVSIVIDVFSIVFFRLWNYHNTDAIFVSDNIVSLSFLIKNCKSESDGVFHPCTSSSLIVRLLDSTRGKAPRCARSNSPAILILRTFAPSAASARWTSGPRAACGRRTHWPTLNRGSTGTYLIFFFYFFHFSFN